MPRIFVVGNEKGGAGKTTCSMHLIAGLLDKGAKVASIDADSRQQSLTSYLTNRNRHNQGVDNESRVAVPRHFVLSDLTDQDLGKKEAQERQKFLDVLDQAKQNADYIVIDTPGSYSHYSRLAHSHADVIITPINDSFVDLDVIAKIDGRKLDMSSPSIYSQMIWEQKMERAERDGGSIDWFIMRNRLSNLDAINKRNISDAIDRLSRRIAFKVAPGFSERVIFRELFLAGLTLLDLNKASIDKPFSLSHVAARQELRDFFESIGIK